jgi:hypothetical protein
MLKFLVFNRHGLSFTIFADSEECAENTVKRLLRKRKLPYYLSICQAI